MKTEEVKASPGWAASPHDLIDLFAPGSPASPYASPNTRKRRRGDAEVTASPIKKRAVEDLLTGSDEVDGCTEAAMLQPATENDDSTNVVEKKAKKSSRMKSISSKLSRGSKRVTIAAPSRSAKSKVLSNLKTSSSGKRRTRSKPVPVAVPVPAPAPVENEEEEGGSRHPMSLRRRKSSLLHLDDEQAQKLKEIAMASPANSLARNRSTSLSGIFSQVKSTGSELLNKAPSSTNMATVFGTPARRMMRSRMSITHQAGGSNNNASSKCRSSSRSSAKPALLRSTSLAVMPTTELTGVARLNAFGTPRPATARPTSRTTRPSRSTRGKLNSKSLRTSKKQIRADVKQLFKRESNADGPAVPGAPATVVVDAAPAKYFGRPLGEVMEHQAKVKGLEELKVPFVVHFSASAIKSRYLEEEGLFRISPSHADIQELEKMVETSEDGGQERLRALNEGTGMMEKPHLFCSTIKKYLRDLPDPVLCTAMSDQWMELARSVTSKNGTSDETSTDEMKKLVAALPSHNQNLLAEVMELALSVSEHSNKNLMTTENLSKVFGPNLLSDAPPTEYAALFDLVNHMIVHSREIFASEQPEEEQELPEEDEHMEAEEDFLAE
mmetsp:Transcript_8664/g.36112  ORF Transcript_8664/g.36112 Transcript_8664/m.36112 type:complete len:610 (+) Transcript_8664:94-1923(+)|eukprot:CAMPEP_0114622156 /NCGR_PEP_ID=MMETSP0168-20121206/9597_1 /TAXON_ID=95228 ORGANISM="Vannella sp., Strain DIVA3 517/6/12" /NCGR_SAMPLE_ID=MMETSP0168 /ASSEMBLY_ACC=CAM_ASM_000044 /LENGTH=609 /DNA_ID=CAMNT_0001833373 /DNA_START=10 /DNA_END=1839 /DNA_ORIENTATION=-